MSTFPEGYANQLRERYGVTISSQIVDPANTQHIDLPHQPGESLPVVEVSSPKLGSGGHNKVLFVPGFGEGIINKASFAAELASEGRHVILPGQNRTGITKNQAGRPDTLMNQALNYLAAMDAVAPEESSDVITHSYGVQVFEAMTRIAPERFEDSHAVVLAPSGSIEGQRLPAMGMQWLRMMASEAKGKDKMEFPDTKGDTGKASAKTLLANPHRTALEIGDLWRRTVDYEQLGRRVASLTVLTYAEDAMFPGGRVAPTLSRAVENGSITWATPVSSQRALSGELSYGGEGAVHDDEQYNPSRVVRASLQFLS